MKTITINQNSISAKAILRLVFLFCALFAGVGSVWGQGDCTLGSQTLTSDMTCANLTLPQGAKVNLNGHTLTVNGNVIINAYSETTLNLGNGGKLIVGGDVTVGSGAKITGTGAYKIEIDGNLTLKAYNGTVLDMGTNGSVTVANNIVMEDQTSITGDGTLKYGGTLTGAGSNNIPQTIKQNPTGGSGETGGDSGDAGGGNDSDDCGTDYDYDPSWCNGILIENVQSGLSSATINQSAEACVFIGGLTANPNIDQGDFRLVNGVSIKLKGASASAINNLEPVDGGYYIYVPSWQYTNLQAISASPIGTPRICKPTITTTKSAIDLSTCAGSAGDAKSFTVSGSALEDNVTIELSSGSAYEISTSADGPYSNSITLNSESAATLAATDIYVRIKAGQTTAAEATLTISSTNATLKTVSLTGTVNEATLNTIEPITFSTECAGTTLSKTITLQGSCFTTAPTITTGENYTISPAIISAENLNEGIEVTVTRSGAADSFSDETALIINGVAVKASATVTKPSISITVKDLSAESFDYAECGTPSSKTFEIKTMCITGDITLSELTNFTASISGSNVTVALKKDLAKGSYSETLTISVGGIEETIELSGAVTEKETPNYTINNQQKAPFIDNLTLCSKDCSPIYWFSFLQEDQYNQSSFRLYDNGVEITSSSATVTGLNASYDTYNGGWRMQTGKKQKIYVKITKDSKVSQSYALEFIAEGSENGDLNKPDCGPSVNAGEIEFLPVCPGDPYAAQTIAITGSNLTEDLTITGKTGYTVSPTSLTPNSDGSLNETVSVTRIAGTDGFNNENAFTISGGGLAESVTVQAKGEVSPTEITLDKAAVTIPAICSGGAWIRQPFKISNINCAVGETTATIPSGFKIYDAATAGNEVSNNLTVGANYWIAPTDNTTVGEKTGTITISNNNKSATIAVSAEVLAGATISRKGTGNLDFDPVCAIEEFTPLSFTVNGSCLSNDITITAPEKFEVSTNGSTWATNLTGISRVGETTIYVKPTISDAGETASGTIEITSEPATPLTINVSAEVQTPSFSVGVPSGNSDYFESSAPSSAISINVSTNDCYTTGFTAELCNINSGDNSENFSITQGETLDARGGDIKVQLNTGLPAGVYTSTVCVTSNSGEIQIPISATVSDIRAIYARADGNWCTGSTWSSSSCDGTSDITDANVPGKGENQGVSVVICSPHKVNLDCNVTDNVHSIIVESGGTLELNTADILTECDITVENGGTLLIGTARKNFSLPPMINSKVIMQSGAIFEMKSGESYGIGIGENCDWRFVDDVNFTQRVALMNNSSMGQGKISSEGKITLSSLVPKENATTNWIGGAIFESTKTTIGNIGSGNNRTESWSGPTGNGVNLHLIGPTEIQEANYAQGSYKFEGGDLEFTGAFKADGLNQNPPAGFNKVEIISPDGSDLKFSGAAMSIVSVPFNVTIQGDVYLEKGSTERDNSAHFAYKGSDIQQIEANNIYFKNQFFLENSEMYLKSNLMQTGHAAIITNSYNGEVTASLHISGNLNSQNSVKCPGDPEEYSLEIYHGAVNDKKYSYLTVGGNMWANIKDGSGMRDYLGVFIVYGNAYWRGYTPGAVFGGDTRGDRQNGTINVQGKFALDNLTLELTVSDIQLDNGKVKYPGQGDNRLYSGPRPAIEYEQNWGYNSCCETEGVVKDYKGYVVTGETQGNFYSLCDSRVIANTNRQHNLCDAYAASHPDHARPEHSPISNCNDTGHITAKNCIDLNGDGDTDDLGECTEGLYAIVGGDFPFEPEFIDGWLPIELVEFSAELKGTSVVLGWSTVSESNNDFFSVQRSSNGANFVTIAEEAGAGTTIIPQHYSHVDYSPLGGTSYYRLKQTDYNGAYSFSPIVPIYLASNDKTFEVIKTTKNNLTRLECEFTNATIVNKIAIHSITGKLEFETEVAPQNNPYVIELPLAPGVYLISNFNIEGKTVVKVMIN